MKIKDQNSKESKVEDTKNHKCGEFKAIKDQISKKWRIPRAPLWYLKL